MSRMILTLTKNLCGVLFALAAVCCADQRPAATQPPTMTAAPTATTVPSTATPKPPEEALNSAECPFAPPAGVAVTCGTLSLPADHDHPDRGSITLFVAIAHQPTMSTAKRRADPLIFLDGGPGSFTIVKAPFIIDNLRSVAGDRDIILFDQRGVGLSEPTLDCPESEETLRGLLTATTSLAEMNAAWLSALTTCRERYLARSVDPALFTVTQSARDVAALRDSLGYRQVNLFGISYGTLLAQHVLALPDANTWVRSAVLDSVLAPDFASVTGDAAALEQALARVSANCAADAACAARYGDVTARFVATFDRLNSEPLTVDVFDPVTRQPLKMVVNGYRFWDAIFTMLYQRQSAAYVPLAIERASRGFGDQLHDALQSAVVRGAFTSEVMQTTTACSLMLPESQDAIDVHNERAATAFDVTEETQWWAVSACDLFDVTPEAGAGQLINSAVPVLILAGDYDPATPIEGAQRVADNLGNATYLAFAGTTHGVLHAGGNVSACAQPITSAFIANPSAEIDTGCVAEVKPLGFVVR